MCKEHLPLLEQLAPRGMPQAKPEIRDRHDNVVVSSTSKPKQTLYEFMLEVESYHAEKEGRPSDPVSLGLADPDATPVT